MSAEGLRQLKKQTKKKTGKKTRKKLSTFRWDAIISVCLSSTFHATKAALPLMIEKGWGRVINTGKINLKQLFRKFPFSLSTMKKKKKLNLEIKKKT